MISSSRIALVVGAFALLPMTAHAKFSSADPVGFAEGGAGQFNRYAYSQNDPVNRKDPDGRDDFFVGGNCDQCAGIGANAVKPFADKFAENPGGTTRISQNRDVQFIPHGSSGFVQLAAGMQSSAERGSPVNVACHSQGCATVQAAAEAAGVRIDNLVTVDPVGDSWGGTNTAPAGTKNWVNVEGTPASGSHNRSDAVEGLGEAISSFDTSGARQVQSTANHNDFEGMFNAAGGTELFDNSYKN